MMDPDQPPYEISRSMILLLAAALLLASILLPFGVWFYL
jgi:hypothetical protein